MKMITKADLDWWREKSAELDWVFATTYAEGAPHEYVVPEKTPGFTKEDCVRAARAIRTFGEPMTFYKATNIYLTLDDGWKYFPLDKDVRETTIINRGRADHVYGAQNQPRTASGFESPYDAYASEWDSDFGMTDDEKAATADLIREVFVDKLWRTLDIGCGTGLPLDLGLADPARYVGIDPSTAMLNELVWKHKHLAGVHPMTYAEAEERRVLCGTKFDTVLALGGSASYLRFREFAWPIAPAELLDGDRSSRLSESRWRDRYAVARRAPQAGPPHWVLACAQGHVQFADPRRARDRADGGFHCAVCRGTRLIASITSLAATHPEVAAQWNWGRNSPSTPSDVLPGSRTPFWWSCDAGHAWSATPDSRTRKHSGCPYCAGTAIVTGEQDIATTHPHLAALWDGTVEQRQPHEVSARHTGVRIHLRCPSGHTWVRSPARLVAAPSCPYCEGRTLTPGINDLATTHPDLVTRWDHTANSPLAPNDVSAGATFRATWHCPYDHHFTQKVGYMARRATPSCPVCNGRLLVPGINDIATKVPELATERDEDLNPLHANETVPGRGRWWWRCALDHVQLMAVHERLQGGGCTACPPEARIARRAKPGERRLPSDPGVLVAA
ncbi:zinc-ribbon domain-containing protein [Demequina sp. B12]|uniref:zinc-ribbon domain-containing protein n=1 Tax=Demequina sp. B12 TaxID=2992757 RepID=UPI00237B9851|nr:zinc-ribbon domain-containing protein [Demequina sp. B12]MDE0572167.1 zinc-ribbon domain-containing protein [Demequina sp. B12]